MTSATRSSPAAAEVAERGGRGARRRRPPLPRARQTSSMPSDGRRRSRRRRPRRRDGDPAGADAELDDRAAGLARLVDVEGDVLDDAAAPGVVERRDPVVGTGRWRVRSFGSASGTRPCAGFRSVTLAVGRRHGGPASDGGWKGPVIQSLDGREGARNRGAGRDLGRSSAAELEDARVRYLGRKSELAQALREVRDRETGCTLNGVRERARGRRRRARARRSSAPNSSGALTEEPSTSRSPATSSRSATCTRSPRSAAQVEDAFLGLGYEVATTARSRRSSTTSTSSRSRRGTRPGRRAPPSSSTPSGCCARRPRRRRSTRWRSGSRRSTWSRSAACYRRDAIDATHYPIFHQFEGLAVDRGHDARRPEGHAAARDARALRRRPRVRSARTTSPSPSRRSSPTSRAGSAAARAAAPAGTPAGSRWAAPGWSTRGSSRTSASTRRSGRGFAFGCGLERVAQLALRHPGHPPALGERPARAEAVLSA